MVRQKQQQEPFQETFFQMLPISSVVKVQWVGVAGARGLQAEIIPATKFVMGRAGVGPHTEEDGKPVRHLETRPRRSVTPQQAKMGGVRQRSRQ